MGIGDLVELSRHTRTPEMGRRGDAPLALVRFAGSFNFGYVGGMRGLFERLFPTLAHPNKDCGVIEWAIFALALVLAFAVLTALAGEMLYDFGYYDGMLKSQYGIERNGWTPDD